MISVSNVSMRYGAKVLFEDVSVQFIPGRRYGLTGPNGAGKSTFMKILANDIDAQKGTVVRPKKVSVLRQDQYAFDNYRLIDTVIMGNKGLWAALEEREKIYNKAEMTDEDGMRLGELEGIVGEEDGYTAESDAAILLQGLDIPDELHERKMASYRAARRSAHCSRRRFLVSRRHCCSTSLPTISILNLSSGCRISWSHFEGTLITISHDRHFLNSVCTHIADIDYEDIIIYTGGYDDMVLAKTQVRSRLESQNDQREKKIAQLNEFIARFSAGTRSSQVTSRKKEVERLQTSELARSNIARPFIRFDMHRPSGKHVLEFEHISKAYDGVPVIKDFSGAIMRGERIALMGRNGQGKTTMIRSLLANTPILGMPEDKEFKLDKGTTKWGHEAQVGYFPQDIHGIIEKGTTVQEWLHSYDPQKTKEEIRGVLGQMLFRGEEGVKPTDALSGGEAARLVFCRLMMQKPNFLVFDEPTNHLDLESINALNQALQKFEGTVLLVTHDFDLIDEVATRIWHFEEKGIVDFKGPYAEYMAATAATASR